MPDILPVRLQDFLYSRKPELRKGKIVLGKTAKGRKTDQEKSGRLGMRRMTGLLVR